MECGGVSTLVLIDDREFELRVSSGLVSFSSWAAQSHPELTARITLSLKTRDIAADGTQPAHLPVVITPPSTARFLLAIATNNEVASSATGPLMPLLRSDRPLGYVVEFVSPSTAESDFAWDNFQDQIVIHSKLGKLVVALKATKQQSYDGSTSDSSSGECVFHPRSLPTVRTPALKLFDYIERTNAVNPQPPEAGTAALHRNEMRVSESFNGARRTPTQALEPLPPIATPASRPNSRDFDRSARRAVTPGQTPSDKTTIQPVLQPSVAEISSLKEARAVISQLRVQHLTSHRGVMSGAASSTARTTVMPSVRAADEVPTDEAGPEAHLLTAKRELDAFNSVVATAKQRVASETATAKNELCYYEQFLPKATVSKPATPPLAVTLAPSGSFSSSSLSAMVDMSKYDQPKAQRVAKKRATRKLPSLSSDSNATFNKAENNQELSPRKNGSPTQRVTTEKASTERKRTPMTARRPPEVQQQQQRSTTKEVATASKAPSNGRTSVRSLSAAKKPVGAQSKGRKREPPTRRQQAEDENDQLSDFDDADPEIDAAPDLPEELTGVAALENDSDMDNDGF